MQWYLTTETHGAKEVMFHVSIPAEYEQPDEVMVVLPPLIDRRQDGCPRNHKCISSTGENTYTQKQHIKR